MTSTLPNAFEEETEQQEKASVSDTLGFGPFVTSSISINASGSEKMRSNSPEHDGGPHLNAATINGSTTKPSSKSNKTGGILNRISKNTLFRVFLLLLILALLLPILILVALIYQNMNNSPSIGSLGASRSSGALQQIETSKALAGEEAVPNAKNEQELQKQMEQIYKNEPWRRDPTSAWKQLGTKLSDSIDTTNNPCGDFDAYACGQWKERNPLDGRQEISEQTLAYENVKEIILAALDGITPDDSNKWPNIVKWAKNFYDRCISMGDEEMSERRASVIAFLSNALSSAPPSASNDTLKRNVRSAIPSNEDTQNATGANETSASNKPALEVEPGTSSPSSPSERVQNISTEEGANSNAITEEPHPFRQQNYSSPENVTEGNHRHQHHNVTESISLNISSEGYQQETTPLAPSEINSTLLSATTGPEITGSSQAPEFEPTNVWRMANSLSSVGVPSFFDVAYIGNPKESNAMKTILSPPELPLKSRRFYLEPYLFSKQSAALEKLIRSSIKELKKSSGSDDALFPDDSSTARAIIQFEQAIAKASPSAKADSDEKGVVDIDELQSRIPNAKAYSFSNLQSRWPSVDWRTFLPEEAKKIPNNQSTGNGGANESSPFIVTDPAYIDQLVGLLEDNDPATIVNYLKWRYIFSVADYLQLSGANDQNLNNTCYKTLENNLPLILGHVVYKTNYSLSKEEKNQLIYTNESIQYLFNNRTKKSFKNVIDFSGQISNASKKLIIDELQNLVLVTEWPDFVKDGASLDAIYVDDMNVASNKTFIEILNNLRAPDVLDREANAWSNVIPDVFVASRFVSGETIATVYDPRVLNTQMSESAVGQFATISWQLAREMAKSLRYFDKAPLKGTRIDQCLINQYNQFCYQPPINSCVDGAWTLDDNFADTLALQVAYKAYTTWGSLASAAGSSDAFPAYLVASNLGKFTMDQIFLLAYGASFCDNESPEYTTDWLASHKTAPKEFRLRGSVENLDDFQLAFRCKTGDKMYRDPKERCQLS